MSGNQASSQNKKALPTAAFVLFVLLLIDGVLVLLSCLFYPGHDATRPYYAVGSVVTIIASILVLSNHRWALPSALACTILLSIDLAAATFLPIKAFVASHHPLWDATRTLVTITFYWVGFAWYRRWASSNASVSNRKTEGG